MRKLDVKKQPIQRKSHKDAFNLVHSKIITPNQIRILSWFRLLMDKQNDVMFPLLKYANSTNDHRILVLSLGYRYFFYRLYCWLVLKGSVHNKSK